MKVLLDHVSFKALPGDMIALMGPSGAGKTTLLLALNGYLPPTSGQVRINGEDLYAIYDDLRGSSATSRRTTSSTPSSPSSRP